MAGLLTKIVRFFEDPAERTRKLRLKLNAQQSRFSLEVKKQDRFLRDYLGQAVEAKRTGDSTTLGPIKSSIVLTVAMRRRAQQMLHAVRLFATKVDQMESYQEFCSVLSDVSSWMGNTISSSDVVKAQENLQKGIQNAQSADELMRQILTAFENGIGDWAEAETDSSGLKGGALDDMIAKLAGEKDTATENHLEELLAKL